MSQEVGFEAGRHLSLLINTISSQDRAKLSQNRELFLYICFPQFLGHHFQDWMTKILTKAAEDLEIYVKSPSSLTISTTSSMTLHGSMQKLEKFYQGLPSTVKAKKSRFESGFEELTLAPIVNFSFAADESGRWFGPLSLSLNDQMNPEKGTVNTKLLTSGDKSSDFQVKAYQTVGLQSNSPTMFSLSRANYCMPFLNASFASIQNNILEKKVRSAEWQVSLNSTAYDHSNSNLRFNNSCIAQQQLAQHPTSINHTAAASPQISPSARPSKTINPTSTTFSSTIRAGSEKSRLDKLPLRSQFILMVSGTDWRKHGAKELCNLFTNYGNIELAVCLEDGSGMFLNYLSKQAAEYAIEYLNGTEIDGDLLTLEPVAQSYMRDRLASCEFTSFAPRKRFSSKGPGLPNRVNPISRTLHVTYHHDRADRQLADDSILHSLETFGQIVRIKREVAPKKKNMWFVEFFNEASAIKAVMKQHNKLYMGGTLRISFTKTI